MKIPGGGGTVFLKQLTTLGYDFLRALLRLDPDHSRILLLSVFLIS